MLAVFSSLFAFTHIFKTGKGPLVAKIMHLLLFANVFFKLCFRQQIIPNVLTSTSCNAISLKLLEGF